ncbi:4-hydroxythreonine-4-phosphate dehydrogenase PdxA [bacterium]|nr:4-hydroxythreonine-4-phosphate dehydrogenase PdxA [bacterium]
MGDPGGVGPEVCLRLLSDPAQYEGLVPVVFGDAAILGRVAKQCGFPSVKQVVPFSEDLDLQAIDDAALVDFSNVAAEAFQPGQVTSEGGEACYQYIMRAIDFALAGKADGIATGPINKEALHAAKHFYPGHTEIFIERCGNHAGCMMLTSPELTCSFVTTHVGYAEVPQLLTIERIGEVIDLTVAAMRKIRRREPRLLVCGLNPHAGEHGLFGNQEEERIITPAVEAARQRGVHIDGPVPPDTAFLAERRPLYDCVICMYHDQGHIPLKALAFDVAVNTTLGLPIVRTSVDHGTAFDIAWQGKAKVSSMVQAVRLARDLASK